MRRRVSIIQMRVSIMQRSRQQRSRQHAEKEISFREVYHILHGDYHHTYIAVR